MSEDDYDYGGFDGGNFSKITFNSAFTKISNLSFCEKYHFSYISRYNYFHNSV